MKFYIISAILNIGILFIPFAQPIINKINEEKKEEQVITVELDKIEVSQTKATVDMENNEKSNGTAKLKKGENNTEKQIVVEKNNNPPIKQQKVEKINVEKNTVQQVVVTKSEKKQKTEQIKSTVTNTISQTKINSNSTNVSSTANASNSGNKTGESGKIGKISTGSIYGSEYGNSTQGKKTGSGIGTKGEGKGLGNSEKSKESGRSKSGGCSVTGYRSTLKYPSAALRLNKKGSTSVTVTVKVSNGNITNVSASGSNPFKDAALSEARSKLRVSGEGSCIITKVYTFNLN